jgi:xylulokinase
VKALLEGVAFNLRWIFENYRKDFGFRPAKIRAIGGGSVNGKWMQGIADITGMTVETISQPTMAGALGAAACVLVGSGVFRDFNDINRFIEVKQTFSPDPTLRDVYDPLFQSYKNIYMGLKKAYIEANFERFNR